MDNKTQEREKLHAVPSVETARQEAKPETPNKIGKAKEVKEVLETTGLEALESAEGIEAGKASEVTAEDKTHAPAGGSQKAYSTDEIEVIRAKLLAALPPQEVMIKQIRNKLSRQEKVLTKRMKKLQKKSHIHAFELNIVVAQLRKVREYFSMLAHATYELIKHLWLKIVHGV